MYADALSRVKKCEGCQRHGRFMNKPASVMKPVLSACPFDQWGIDIVRSFPIAPAQKKFLIVAVDYFSNGSRARPWHGSQRGMYYVSYEKTLSADMGFLISDNGRQFQGQKVMAWCEQMKIEQRFTSVVYPQANGQTGVTNRSIVQALRARLYGVGKDWVEELPSVLWAYRTTPRTSTGETPFSMVYGSKAVLPAEIGEESARVRGYDEENEERRA